MCVMRSRVLFGFQFFVLFVLVQMIHDADVTSEVEI